METLQIRDAKAGLSAVVAAADLGIVPGDNDVGVEKPKRGLEIAFVHGGQQPVAQRTYLPMGGVFGCGFVALSGKANWREQSRGQTDFGKDTRGFHC